MTTVIEPISQKPNDESLLRDLIQALVIETVQAAVERGLTSTQGGELAFKRLVSRGWDKSWMRLFGPSALAAQWRNSISAPRQKFYETLPETTSKPVVEAEVRPTKSSLIPELEVSVSPSATEQPAPDAVVEQAAKDLLPIDGMPAPQHAIQPVQHGREDSLAVLSRDMRRLLSTPLTVAGIWIRAGELRRADVRTIRAESRQRLRSNIAGYRIRDAKLASLETYYDNDGVDLNALVLTGRFSTDKLHDFMDAIR